MKLVGFTIGLYTDDVDRLMAFYKDVVGLPFNEESVGPEISGPTKEPARALFNLFVEDSVAEQSRLEAQGVVFTRTRGQEPWGGIISTFNDPDGNTVQLIEFSPGG